MTAIRRSPIHDRLESLGARFVERNDMAIAAGFGAAEAGHARSLGLADLSHLSRTGFKGAKAAEWVGSQGLALPAPNGWNEIEGGGLIARLASSEFFIEDGESGTVAARVRNALAGHPAGVYPVMRQDAGFALVGERVNELLVETCNVNFRELEPAARAVVMTMMVGVSVLVIRRDLGRQPCYRVWCDPTMAPYLWDTLHGIVVELGGGPVGVDGLAGSPQA
jgi:sarcosine oxidase, subunit gamma